MRTIIALFPIALLAGLIRAADVPATQPLSPAAETAIHDLSSEDFATREQALKNLELALGEQTRALLAITDPESKARITSLLEFNEGLSRWVLNTQKLPEAERQKLLEFGLRSENLPTVAKLASSTPATRIEAVRALAHNPDPAATDLLAPMLDDNDRAVYVATMEAIWDRAPTDAVVDRLWERAVEAGFAIYNPQPGNQPDVAFHGQPLGPTFFDNAAYRRMQDSNIATDVLVHLHPDGVNARLKSFFERVDRTLNGRNQRDNRIWMYGPNSAPMKNVYTLLTKFRPKEALPPLYRLATGQIRQPFNGQINNARYFWSNRTVPLAMLLELTDQHPEDYKLSQLQRPPGMWAFPTQLDEENAVKKLQSWWNEHMQPEPAASQPDTVEHDDNP